MDQIANASLTFHGTSAGKLLCMKTKILLIFSLCAGLAGSASAQVVLTPLNPTLVDNTYSSLNGDTQAEIDFVNDSSVPVDVYWIDYSGIRELYYSDLAPGNSYFQQTYLTHPWLIAEYGSGDTTARGTGDLITAFEAVTANPDWDPSIADVAYITGPVPEQPSWLVPLMALVSIVCLRRKFAAPVNPGY
jgi:hypothetical protein